MPLCTDGGPWGSLARQATSSQGTLLHLPGPCSESRAEGWRTGENGGSPGVSGGTTALCGLLKVASWSPVFQKPSPLCFGVLGPLGELDLVSGQGD